MIFSALDTSTSRRKWLKEYFWNLHFRDEKLRICTEGWSQAVFLPGKKAAAFPFHDLDWTAGGQISWLSETIHSSRVVSWSFNKGKWLTQLRVAFTLNCRGPFGRNLWAMDKDPMKVFHLCEPFWCTHTGMKATLVESTISICIRWFCYLFS